MNLNNATVKKVDKQSISVLRECASNPDCSFTEEEMAIRIGIDPYNIVRRASRFAADLEGWCERLDTWVSVQERDRSGVLGMAPKKVFLWRLHEDHRWDDRADIMRQFKEEDQP